MEGGRMWGEEGREGREGKGLVREGEGKASAIATGN